MCVILIFWNNIIQTYNNKFGIEQWFSVKTHIFDNLDNTYIKITTKLIVPNNIKEASLKNLEPNSFTNFELKLNTFNTVNKNFIKLNLLLNHYNSIFYKK